MLRNQVFSRNIQSAICGAALLLGAAQVRAEEAPTTQLAEVTTCENAYTTAQARQQSGDLVAAHELYGKCTAEVCGSELWQQCLTREIALHTKMPSVVLLVSDHAGEPLVDVKVMVDGRLLTTKLNGLALPLNPGKHTFSFFSGTESFESETITLGEGDRNHLISATGEQAELHAQR